MTKKFVQHAEKRGIKGLFITVDAPQLGRREKVILTFAQKVACCQFGHHRTCVRSSKLRSQMRWTRITRRWIARKAPPEL